MANFTGTRCSRRAQERSSRVFRQQLFGAIESPHGTPANDLALLSKAKELEVRGILSTSPTGVPRPLQCVGCIDNCETFVEMHHSGASRHYARLRRHDLIAPVNTFRGVRVLYPQKAPV